MVRRMRNKYLSHMIGAFVLILYTVPAPVLAEARALTLEQVLDSTNHNYPKILAALDKVEEAKAKYQEATGAFDMRLDGDAKIRADGFYDGDWADARVVKPLAPMNAEVYAGYSRSNGTFPVYDNQLVTQSDGEARIGVIFSLLRNRAIDARRFGMMSADYNFQLSELDQLLTRIDVLRKAQYTYAEWAAAGKVMQVYRDLLQLAEERQRNLEKQVKSGAAARIMLVENRQNILKRKAALNEAERNLVQKANDLSMYWRNADGNPLRPEKNQIPKILPIAKVPDAKEQELRLQNVLEQRPELKAMSVSRSQQQAELKMGENSLSPQVDLGLELSQDYGTGPRSLDPAEGIVKLKFSVPLQRELGRGKVNAAKARLSRIEHEQKLFQDKVKVELRNIGADLDALEANLDISAQEIKLAKEMERAERSLLQSGASNLFLVNSREEKSADAQIKNILSQLYLVKALATYHAATVQWDKLGVKTP